MTKNIRTFIKAGIISGILYFFFISSNGLNAQVRDDNNFGLFDSDEILDVSLRFDIGRFMLEKPEEESIDAALTIYPGKTDSVFCKIKLRARGNYRRRICDFPPVMLDFDSISTGYRDIDRLEKVKLVSHCMPDEEYDIYVMREYLAYKIYNTVTAFSFRVRLLNISYYDINYDTLYSCRKGFLLEPVDNLEKRFGMDEVEDIEIKIEDLNRDNIMRLSVFQFLIANSDWFAPSMHNIKIFGDSESLQDLIAVPYDFDYSGWVNTGYALARDDLGLEDIRERAFLGPCGSEKEYMKILEYYTGLEDSIIDTVKEFPYLNGSNRRDLIRYIRSFYRMFKRNEILDICMEACNK